MIWLGPSAQGSNRLTENIKNAYEKVHFTPLLVDREVGSKRGEPEATGGAIRP